MSESLLVFDVGNSRIKASLTDGEKLGPIRAAALDDPASLAALSTWPGEPSPLRAMISSVNPYASQRLIALLSAVGIETEWHLLSNGELIRDRYLPCPADLLPTTGADRLLSSIGAHRRSPDQAAIVVDCGSAVTVNFTDQGGMFQGGAILPGRRLMAQALAKGTAELPQITHSSMVTSIGRNTQDAITAGIANAIGGGVCRLIEQLQITSNSEPLRVFLTGGDAEFVASMLQQPFEIVTTLVLEGLLIAAQERRRRKS